MAENEDALNLRKWGSWKRDESDWDFGVVLVAKKLPFAFEVAQLAYLDAGIIFQFSTPCLITALSFPFDNERYRNE